jgi:hypothetical protein
MTKKKRRRKVLCDYAEDFALSLLFEASGGKVGRIRAVSEKDKDTENPVSFKDRRALLDSVTKLLAAQKPSEDDEEDGLSSYREHLRGNSGETESGADPDVKDDTI